jgi:cytochrome c oxidase cbb3-type subunit 2
MNKNKYVLLLFLSVFFCIASCGSESVPDANAIYQKNCSGCHGKNGDGKGPLASSMKIKPTNFTEGMFKYRSTPFGAPPTDSDLEKIIKKGLKGVEMRKWEDKLTDKEIVALVNLIKSFSPETFKTVGLSIVSPKFSDTDINRGKKLFLVKGCVNCHGPDGKGNGDMADMLENYNGTKAYPRNLSNHRNYRLGADKEEIFFRISTGLNGTPMVGFGDELYPEEIEDIASYLVSLYKKEGKDS